MFNSEIVSNEYLTLIGWKQHYDTEEIDIDQSLQVSESKEYYQEKHDLLRLDRIQVSLPSNYPLEKYLVDVVESSITEVFTDIIQYRQVKKYGKTLLDNQILLNRYGFGKDKIVNQNRFVGFQIRMFTIEALTMLIKSIGFQFDAATTFNMYLYHSSKVDPIKTIEVTTTDGHGWDWNASDIVLTGMKELDYEGGVFVLGYYQEDLVSTMAINNTNFNWDKGECGTCNNSFSNVWKSITKHYHIYPVYVPSGSYEKGKMFDLEDVFYCNTKSWGMNLRLSVVCDLTNFFIENKFAFKNLLALKVVYKVLKMISLSNETNHIEEELKIMIIRDLEGDKETKSRSIPSQYNDELKAVTFNISHLNKLCLSCEDVNRGPYFSNI